MTLPRIHKTKLLLVTSVGDTFFGEKSRKQLDRGFEIGVKIVDHIKDNIDQYYGVVNLATPTEYWSTIRPFTPVKSTRLVNIVFNSPKNKFLDISNEISLKNINEENMLFNGNEFDFLFPSKDYEIHLCGVDTKGVYKNLIEELLEKGYKVYLYSDMSKRFYETNQFLKTLRNRNFEYVHSKTALV